MNKPKGFLMSEFFILLIKKEVKGLVLQHATTILKDYFSYVSHVNDFDKGWVTNS